MSAQAKNLSQLNISPARGERGPEAGRNAAVALRPAGTPVTRMLEAEEELQFIRNWQFKGCVRSRDRIILAYQPLSIRVLRKMRAPAALYEDLLQDACFGLMKALDRFDTERGVRFGTYAIWWIRAEIQDALVRKGPMTGGMTGSARRIQAMSGKARRSALEKLRSEGIEESDANLLKEMADIIGISVKQLQEHEMSLKIISLNSRLFSAEDDGSRSELIDIIACEKTNTAETDVISREARELTKSEIEDMLGRLTEREAYVIRRRIYSEDKPDPLRCIGALFDLTPERIRQIEARAMKKLAKLAQGRNLRSYLDIEDGKDA